LCHCAPPQNKVTPQEVAACQPFLQEELRLLSNLKVVVCLGSVALNGVWATLKTTPALQKRFNISALPKKPTFGHNVVTPLSAQLTLITSYHPSQQNTFTGKLTEPMLDAVFTLVQTTLASNYKLVVGGTGLEPVTSTMSMQFISNSP
jgi:uracil-DNA glycosylase family 4